MTRYSFYAGLILVVWFSRAGLSQQVPAPTSRPRITLDEFFNFIRYSDIKLSPDGNSVVIATERPDWKLERFRHDLWLWTEARGGLVALTQSGHDSDPQWSPDGNWIAFISDRKVEQPPAFEEEAAPKEPPQQTPPPRRGGDDEKADEKPVAHVYLISVNGGEAFPVTRGTEEVHAVAWSPDSRYVYFATRTPWSKAKRDAYKEEWKDVVRYRESERGDVIARISVADAIARQAAVGDIDAQAAAKQGAKGAETAETLGSQFVSSTPQRVQDMVISPSGAELAFATDSISQRIESVEDYELYLVDLPTSTPRQITHNQAIETHLRWSPDSRSFLFAVHLGSIESKYEDVQDRVYSVDPNSGAITRWGANFPGAIIDWGLTSNGALVAAGVIGTQVQMYSQQNPAGEFKAAKGWQGTYEQVATALHSPRVAVVYSSMQRPTEVYLADSLDRLQSARPLTALNKLFTERALPEGVPYQWRADDGRTVEGMLVYPPGKKGAKHLRMFTLIHGGPGGPPDCDRFSIGLPGLDWAILAASNDWLVFRPNFRGSTGYGDNFMREMVPNIVSRPGKDILEGIDALVKQGIADPDHLTVGGYSYGGYITNWLITQSTPFRAAVTGAGAAEHVANWGNDDLSFDDAYILGGAPWLVQNTYNSEAAIWQINKVTTPTHVVAGADDTTVSVGEDYLLERALHTVGVPTSLLIFPGEEHRLPSNPWHGKIKVREELKWLEKYDAAAR